jgi:hypothetical protein
MATSDSPKAIALTRTLQVAKAAISTPFTGDIVVDGFESGDFSSPGYPEFGWSNGSTARNIVSMTAGGDPVSVFTSVPDGTVYAGDPRDWTANSGDNSLRVRYVAGQNWQEQDFSWPGAPLTEMWLAFDLRVPVNFDHQPSSNPDARLMNNNKLLRVYTGSGGTTVGLSFRRTTRELADGPGNSYYFGKVFSDPANGGDFGNTPFITIPSDRGRWMRIILRAKLSSTDTAKDGIFQVWRKWENEANFTLEMDRLDYMPPSQVVGEEGFNTGYIMGYANATYAVDTEFLIDNFVISADPLI